MSDHGPTGTPTAVLPERVHLPLLTLITQQSLDEDYLVAAERRAAGARRPTRSRTRRVAAVVVAAFGVLASTAFVQTSQNADAADAGRETLIARLEAERDLLARQQQLVADLRAGNLEAEEALGLLTDTEQEALVRNRRLQVRTGFLRVTGPGVRVTVTDRPAPDLNEKVRDTDLRLLVNGLFEAGAEAIAVNGQRLTARTAIRNSGLAIEVNDRGIAGPYVVEAIGDERTLSARLFDTTTGLAFVGTADFYGFSVAVDNVDDLTLPAGPAGLLTLRSASTDRGEAGPDGRPERPSGQPPISPSPTPPGSEDDAP